MYRHKHEDKHRNLCVGGVVRQHFETFAVDHFTIEDNVDEFREVRIEPAGRRGIENEHLGHMGDEQQQAIVEEQSNEVDADRSRAKSATKENDDTNDVAEESTDEYRCENIAQNTGIDTLLTKEHRSLIALLSRSEFD